MIRFIVGLWVGYILGVNATRLRDLYLVGHVNPDMREQFFKASDTLKDILYIWDKAMRLVYPQRYFTSEDTDRLTEAYDLAFRLNSQGQSQTEILNSLIDRYPDIFQHYPDDRKDFRQQWRRITTAMARRRHA